MNDCKYCGTQTKNEHFCSKRCQAKFNAQKNHKDLVQFKCQKHQYSKLVPRPNLYSVKCPQCELQKKLNSIIDKTCKKCGKELMQYFGSGQFCSRACANSRTHSQQTKNKIAKSLKKDKHDLRARNCIICNKEFILLYNQSSTRKTCSAKCLHQLTTIRAKQNGANFDIKLKLSNKQKQKVQNGTHKGWVSRNIISYPQKFFMQVLDSNGIQYIHNYKVAQRDLDQSLTSYYFLDFYLPKYNIDLQIDGKQHKYLDRIEHDIKRDQLLSKMYKVYRIQWNQINSEQGKLLIKQKIDQFLTYIQDVV